MIKTLGRTTWDKIKVGEVFAEYDRGWVVLIKTPSFLYDGGEALILTGDWAGYKELMVNKTLYKLPLSVQRNWIEWEGK